MIEIKLCELYVKLFCGFCGFVLNGLWILCDPCQAVFVLLLSYNTEDSYNSAQEKPSGLHGFADAGGLYYVLYPAGDFLNSGQADKSIRFATCS